MIIRGTTPTLSLAYKNADGIVDLSAYDEIYITLKDKNIQFDVTKDRMIFNTDHTINATLTQEETLSLSGGDVKVQIRARLGVSAIASEIVTTHIGNVLKEGVI